MRRSRHSGRGWWLPVWLLLLAGLVAGVNAQASSQTTGEELAAVLTVTSADLDIRRVDTDAWLPLRVDAIAPTGTGDQVQTDELGRGLIAVPGAFDLLLMPRSILTILTLEQSPDGTLIFAASLDGHFVQQPPASEMLDTTTAVAYRLTAGALTITGFSQDARFAVWSDFEATPVLIVQQGTVTVYADDPEMEQTVEAGQTARLEAGVLSISPLTTPASAARLIGELRGCRGTINAGDASSLNIRVGPGTGYTIIGYIVNGGAVRVVGVNETATWYRVQKFSGFGWSEAKAVNFEGDCDGLPVFPRLYQEANMEGVNLLPFEVDLLRPYYGEPIDNLWFYRSLRPEADVAR